MREEAQPLGHGRRPQAEAAHPTPATYIKIATILAMITGVEVAIFYMGALHSVILPIFLVLSGTKFALVAMFYMHLKFDSRMFSGFFVGGLLLAASVLVALMALFGVLTREKIEPALATSAASKETSAAEATLLLAGDKLFVAKGCGACHTIDGVPGAVGVVGPKLNGVASRAGSRRPGLSGEAYIRQSIEDPTNFVVEGFAPLMPSLRSAMTNAEFAAIVSFLLTLK